MSVYASLAIVLGVIVGIGGCLFYLKRKKKKFIAAVVEQYKQNTLFLHQTLKSGGIDPPKKVEVAKPLKGSLKEPSPSPKKKVKKKSSPPKKKGKKK